MDSIWEDTAKRVHFDALSSNKNTDILIIGGGITGILCAYKLKNAGVDCILVEANEISGGITKNTTAKITLGHGLIYDKMIKRFGEDKTRLYIDAQTKQSKNMLGFVKRSIATMKRGITTYILWVTARRLKKRSPPWGVSV